MTTAGSCSTRRIIGKEFSLSGSEQNPDLTGKSVRGGAQPRPGWRAGAGAAFQEQGLTSSPPRRCPNWSPGMNALTGEELIDQAELERQILARDREIEKPYAKDLQITAIRGARNYLGDKLIRVVAPHRLLDPAAGPLIAVRLTILTRKSLGGLETDLDGRVLTAAGEPLAGRLCGRRGQRVRRRRRARLPFAGRQFPRRLHLLRPDRRPGRGGRHRLSRHRRRSAVGEQAGQDPVQGGQVGSCSAWPAPPAAGSGFRSALRHIPRRPR